MKLKDKLYLPKRLFSEDILQNIASKEKQLPKQHWYDKQPEPIKKYLTKVA